MPSPRPSTGRSARSSRPIAARRSTPSSSGSTARPSPGRGREGPAHRRRGDGERARDRAARKAAAGRRHQRQAEPPPPGAAVHDEHPAAGSEPQAQLQPQAHDARRAGPVRGRRSRRWAHRTHYLHAHRFAADGDRRRCARRATSIAARYGLRYVVPGGRNYDAKSKGAQEAHEAIRPTSFARIPNRSSTCSTRAAAPVPAHLAARDRVADARQGARDDHGRADGRPIRPARVAPPRPPSTALPRSTRRASTTAPRRPNRSCPS